MNRLIIKPIIWGTVATLTLIGAYFTIVFHHRKHWRSYDEDIFVEPAIRADKKIKLMQKYGQLY